MPTSAHARRLLAACAALLLVAITAEAARAQRATGAIRGTVVDSSGGVLPGAAVTVTNTGTGAERALVSDADGRFSAPALQVGAYEVIAALAGFAARRQEGLQLHVGETVTLRLELELAVLEDTIALAGTPPVLEPARSHVSSVVNATSIANLPVNGRNFIDFVLLTPGVTRDVQTGDLSFAGQRGTLNSLVVDGVDDTNTFFGQPFGRTGSGGASYQFSLEAVLELQVNANAYGAEYGRAAGGVVNVVTRSGTNEFSGALFEFYRDQALNANTAINESLGRPKSPYHSDQFGGAAGGPIVRDRHFYFASYDGQRNSRSNPVFLNVPSSAPGDPLTAQALQRLEPLAASWERTHDQDVFLARTDHHLTGAHRLALRYNHRNFAGEGLEHGGPQQSFETTGASTVYTRSFVAAAASVLGSSVFNEARVQIARDRRAGEANSDRPQADVRQGGTLVLRIGRNFFSPRETTIDRVQVTDTLTWASGGHTMKAGFDVQLNDILNEFPGNFSGVYVFQTLAGFATRVPDGQGDTYTQAFPGAGTTGARTHPDVVEYALFAQDDWRATDALTVNLGVRYDLQRFAQPPVRNPDPQLAAAGLDSSVLNTDVDNVAPRLGVAWAPAGRTYVVRAGYGLFYGRTPAIMASTAHANNGITVQTITFRGAAGDRVPAWPNRFDSMPAGIAAPPPTIVVFDADYENPRTQQASGGVEWEWSRGVTLSATYLFVKGDDLPRSTDLDVGAARPVTLTVAGTGETLPHYEFAPGPFRNFGRVISFQSTAESRYNGLTIELHRRFAQGYQYRLAYTLGKVVDTVPDATAVVPEGADDRKFASNPADVEADRAPGNSDQRHRLVGSLVYTTDTFADRFGGLVEDILTDWTLSAIYTAQSGQPYSAYVATDINGDFNRFNDIAPGTSRNQFRLPARFSLDPRVARQIGLGGTRTLTLIWEAFNLLNGPHYTDVNDTLYTASGTTLTRNPLFGQFTAQDDPRIMQLAVKLSF